MLFHHYYLASLAPVSFSCISSVYGLEVQLFCISTCSSIWTVFVKRNVDMFLTCWAVQDKWSPLQCACTVFTVDGPLPHSVDISLVLCFNSGSALFKYNGSIPVLCKNQGVKSQPSKIHSHGPHPPLSTFSFTTRQLLLSPLNQIWGIQQLDNTKTCWRRYSLANCCFVILCQLAFSFYTSPGSALVKIRCLAVAGACTKLLW